MGPARPVFHLFFAGPGVAQDAKCTQPAELLDMYPTLIDLCGLPKNKRLEGISLSPQLRDASTKRLRPAVTVHNHDNHGVRSENWRYIRYADGSEELYDMKNDPNEWRNLAAEAKYETLKQSMAKWIPKNNRKPAPGSKHRILTHDKNSTIWEGKKINQSDPIPEIE